MIFLRRPDAGTVFMSSVSPIHRGFDAAGLLMSRTIPFTLSVLLAMQLGVLAFERPWEPSEESLANRAAITPSKIPEPMPHAGIELPSLESLGDTRSRPLFVEHRRPAAQEELPEEAVLPTVAPATKPVGIELSAIVISNGEPLALVREAPAVAVMRAREGEHVGGWKVSRINNHSIELTNGNGNVEISLRHYASPSPPKLQSTDPPQVRQLRPRVIAPRSAGLPRKP